MSDVIAKAPVRANNSPAKAKAVPSPAPAPAVTSIAPAEPLARDNGPTADEQLVAATLRRQVLAVSDSFQGEMHSDSLVLLDATTEALEKMLGGAYVSMYRGAAQMAGAIAIERLANPSSAGIAQMEAIRQSLETASMTYDLSMEPGEVMAAGIRAGQRQFRVHPAPPIRLVEDASQGPYRQAQLFTVLTEVASVALTLSDVLALAGQSKDEWHMRTLIDSANVHARLLGAMADTASGCNMRGDHDAWIYGPNFADEGKAGAA